MSIKCTLENGRGLGKLEGIRYIGDDGDGLMIDDAELIISLKCKISLNWILVIKTFLGYFQNTSSSILPNCSDFLILLPTTFLLTHQNSKFFYAFLQEKVAITLNSAQSIFTNTSLSKILRRKREPLTLYKLSAL